MKLITSIFSNRMHTTNETIKSYLDKIGFKFSYKIINVVGTNGKGSVSHYLTENLQKEFKVGTFTSPHIFAANERIKINNKNIDTKTLEDYIENMEYSNMHFFSIMFIAALQYFEDQKCDYIILEAGIGGSHDPSNIFDGVIGVITSVGRDHMELFGETLEDVLEDKIGIINKNMNFYSGTDLKKMNERISQKTIEKNAKHIIVNNEGVNYKIRNQKLATAILRKEFNIEPNFSDLKGRATLQKINNTTAIIDVAHNKVGIQATLEHLVDKGITFEQVVITISKRKEWQTIKYLFKNKEIFVYQIDDSFISAKDLDAGEVKDLKDFYENQTKNTLYIGSFYSIGDILKNDKN
ncbi:Mur ligase family protein [Mycoplasma todarodis]|uniref:Mur ligase central domain-containing protein n=1 Tax=Mycoplasma todarodis TaxID=1937191 RepID=A0A4R0XMV5_9MOLU|nr:Mur ligase family protein [Mycoplasma todarodis]TCG10802.1 hypothetical protein C4B25_03005 [Mycoplasma todarodis]